MKWHGDEIGVGATDALSRRVSVATLVRLLFKNPNDNEWMLVLERKATLSETENGRAVEVKSQPFGGAVRIRDLNVLRDLIGDFHFDSESSRIEQDFRIFIRPSAWSTLREFCLQHLSNENDPFLETNPERELAEEFADALKMNLKPEQYVCSPITTLVENEATPTNNFYANGSPTVRIYRIFEASLTDFHLIDLMLKNSEGVSDQDLCELAWADFHSGGNGWANASLALPLRRISDFYSSIPPEKYNTPVRFEKNLLDGTVATILDGIPAPKYQRLA